MEIKQSAANTSRQLTFYLKSRKNIINCKNILSSRPLHLKVHYIYEMNQPESMKNKQQFVTITHEIIKTERNLMFEFHYDLLLFIIIIFLLFIAIHSNIKQHSN